VALTIFSPGDPRSGRPERGDVTPGSVAVVLPAAGSGRRFGDQANKIFAIVAGKPVWVHAAERFTNHPAVGCVTIALSPPDEPTFSQQAARWRLGDRMNIVAGGRERYDSVAAALDAIDDGRIELVAIHDAARPLVPRRDIDNVFAAARRHDAAILATPLTGSLKRVIGEDCRSVDRRDLFVALTPQVFKLDLIRHAYRRHRGFPATDDAQLVGATGHPVHLVVGSADNLKITYPEDLRVARALLGGDEAEETP